MIELESQVFIDGPAHAAFEYCLDPRRVYADDPGYTVSDATVTPDGVGTTVRLVAKMLGAIVAEEVVITYLAVVPDERIVFEGHPKMLVLGRTLVSSEVWTHTFTFAASESGTRLSWAVANTVAGPWWLRPMYLIGTRMMGKEIRARLGRVKAGIERQAAAAP